jgi:hypothetical protein
MTGHACTRIPPQDCPACHTEEAARGQVDARAIPALRALAGSLTGDQSIPTRVALSEAARVLDLADVAEGRERP